jgi:recombinational DNA repair protein RecR
MRVSKELEATLVLIEDKHHWCQGALSKRQGFLGRYEAHCVMGALGQVTGCNPFETDAGRLLNNVAWKHYRNVTIGVNDDLGHEATVELLKTAIREAKTLESELLDIPKPEPMVPRIDPLPLELPEVEPEHHTIGS